jgi:hypothetical protein
MLRIDLSGTMAMLVLIGECVWLRKGLMKGGSGTGERQNKAIRGNINEFSRGLGVALLCPSSEQARSSL